MTKFHAGSHALTSAETLVSGQVSTNDMLPLPTGPSGLIRQQVQVFLIELHGLHELRAVTGFALCITLQLSPLCDGIKNSIGLQGDPQYFN